MSKITYLKGDATNPTHNGNKIIVHICNDIGAWGAGFVLAISKRWKAREKNYKEWYNSKNKFELGHVQYVKVENGMLMSIEVFYNADDYSTFISIYVDNELSMVGILDIEFEDGTIISFKMCEGLDF